MGQSVDFLMASIISAPAFRGLCTCKVDGSVLLYNLLVHSLPRKCDTALLHPSKSYGERTLMITPTVSVLWSKFNKKYVLVT
jgi:hypothetical protein